jgi:hypothetical protein
MLSVLVVHGALVGRDRDALRAWLPRWIAAVGLGLAVQAVPLAESLSAHQYRTFRPWFPLTLPYDLGGGEGLAFAMLGPVVVLGLWQLRRRRGLVRAATVLAIIVFTLWLVAPETLHSRYFLWLLPAVGALVGLAVSRRPALAAVVIVAVGAQLVTRLPELSENQIPNRAAGDIVRDAQREGQRACAVGATATNLAAYAMGYREIYGPDELGSCDVVVAAEGTAGDVLARAAMRAFPFMRTLDAEQPGAALSRRPLREGRAGSRARDRFGA